MELKTYSPDDVSIVVGGFLLQSWDECNGEYDEDKNSYKAGTTGEVTRVKNLNELATLTLILPQTSVDNLSLNALALANAVFSISVIDMGGTLVALMPEATVQKPAGFGYKKESTPREWTFKGKMKQVGGGN